MPTNLLKVTTPTGEHRWINLDRVTRVSMATANDGNPILAICFDAQDQVTIHGSDDANRSLIQCVSAKLDSLADQSSHCRAA